MFLLRRRIFILLLLLVAVIVSIVILKANTSLESTDRKASAEIKTEESTHNVDEYVLQDPVASIDGVDISKDEFLDFVEVTQNMRIDTFPSQKVLEDYLSSYNLYNTLENRATEAGLDSSPTRQEELAVLEIITLASAFEEAELPISVEELTTQTEDLDIVLSDDSLIFFANKQNIKFAENEIRKEKEIRDYVLNAYKEGWVRAEQVKLAGLDQKDQYQKNWLWEKKKYLSDLYIQDYLQDLPKTDEDVAQALEEWELDQDFSEYKVAHIYLDDSEIAQQVLNKIINQTLTFEEAALEYSVDESSKGNGGKIANGEWVTFPDKTHPFREAFEGLEESEMTGVVRGISGYHIIKLDAKREQGIPEYMDINQIEQSVWEQMKLLDLYQSIQAEVILYLY